MSQQKNQPHPVARCFRADTDWADTHIEGPAREIELHGRRGLNALSVKTVLSLPDPGHTLNLRRGSLTFWILPLEDVGYFNEPQHILDNEPDYGTCPLLTDHRPLRDLKDAGFFLACRNFWFRPLIYKFSRTKPDDSVFNCHGERAAQGPDDFTFRPGHWYQIGLSWNRETRKLFLYANGVCLTDGYEFFPQIYDEAADALHSGTPLFAMGELAFYDTELSGGDFREIFRSETTHTDPDVMKELETTYDPGALPEFNWDIDESYKKELGLSLTQPEDLGHFYIQGCTDAPRVTEEGLLVETPVPREPPYHFFNDPAMAAKSQVFLHTWKTFEGDLAFEVDFKILKEEGLSFVMIHSSGMQREDYMKDYPLRTTGSMDMAFKENVRNYHWEFYRDMDGIRKDRATSLLFKNPRLHALAYQVLPERLPLHTWHKLQFIQDGRRFRGAINGQTVFDVTEPAGDPSGGTYNFGHLSLRNMFKTKFLWKNLTVYARPPKYTSRVLD